MKTNNLNEITNVIKLKIASKDIKYFEQKIENYKKIKLDHLSILAYVIYNGNLEIIKKIIEKNFFAINLNELEEDGFKTIYYIIDTKILSLKEKQELIDLFVSKLKENFDFKDVHTDFIAYCIALNQVELLIYIYKKYLKDLKYELKNYEEDVIESLLNYHNLSGIQEFKKFLGKQ